MGRVVGVGDLFCAAQFVFFIVEADLYAVIHFLLEVVLCGQIKGE